MCAPASRGVWIDLICAMHEDGRSGELRGTSEQLARLARCSTIELDAALTDLQNNRAAGAEHRNGMWTVTNWRMARDALTREKRSEAGRRGGSKTQANREQIPDNDNGNKELLFPNNCNRNTSIEQVIAFARGELIEQIDAEWFYWKCEGNGWKNNGKPILDWKATIRSWKRAGYLPSQKQNPSGQKIRMVN